MGVFKELLKFGGIIGGLAMLALAAGPAHAGAECGDKAVNAFGDIGGGPFKVAADTRSLTGPSEKFVGLSSEDCTQRDLDEGLNEAAALGAIVEFYPIDSGWHVNATVANGDANADAFAGGLNLMYTHQFAATSTFDSISLGGSAGSLFNGNSQIYSATIGLNWK